jgi:hypothetical protein
VVIWLRPVKGREVLNPSPWIQGGQSPLHRRAAGNIMRCSQVPSGSLITLGRMASPESWILRTFSVLRDDQSVWAVYADCLPRAGVGVGAVSDHRLVHQARGAGDRLGPAGEASTLSAWVLESVSVRMTL